ncbi:uncharacterized protein LOC135226353 isoform X1 [Macrobrachium nipponense]|uniref:uncharacterized protein LOC135226353 isoform X1 n=1 Tax=Macrobrachium nipponense TaxID=159736 RepID=UPI0030C8A59E
MEPLTKCFKKKLFSNVEFNDADYVQLLIEVADAVVKKKPKPFHLTRRWVYIPVEKRIIQANDDVYEDELFHDKTCNGGVYDMMEPLESEFGVKCRTTCGCNVRLVEIRYVYTSVMRLLIENAAYMRSIHDKRNTALHIAAKLGDEFLVWKLLFIGASVDAQNKDKETPLHLAVDCKNVSKMHKLILAGANISHIDIRGNTAAHVAASSGRCECLQVLLELGLDVNCRNEISCTLLHLAAQEGHSKLVHLLISKGANVNAEDDMGNTVLHAAIRSQNVRVVKLIEDGGAVNVQNREQITSLHFAKKEKDIQSEAKRMTAHEAAFSGECAFLENLFELGQLDINSKDEKGHTLLHRAASGGCIEVVELLINKDVDLNVTNENGETPLQYAAYCGQANIVIELLNRQHEEHLPEHTFDALEAAAFGNRLDTIKAIFEKFPHTIEHLSEYRILMVADHASIVGSSVCAWWLIKKISKKAGICDSSLSRLKYCQSVYEKQSRIIKEAGEGHWLGSSAPQNIEEGQIELHYMDEQGNTALHAAVGSGNKDTVASLIEDGALLEARNYRNLTPRNIADTRGISLQKYLPDKPDTRLDSRSRSQLYSILLNIIAQTIGIDAADSRMVQKWKLQVTKSVGRLLSWGVPHERLGSCQRLILPLAITTNNRTLLPMLLAAGFPLTTADSGLGLVQLVWLTPDIGIWVRMIVTRAVINTLRYEHKLLENVVTSYSFFVNLTQNVNKLILELSEEKPREAQFSSKAISLTQLYVTACRYGATLTAWYIWKAGGSNYDRELPYDCTSLEAALDGGHFSTALRLVLDMDANPFLKKNKGQELPIDLFPEKLRVYLLEVMLGKDYRALDKMAEKFKDEDDKRELQQIILLLVVLFLQYTIGGVSISSNRWKSFLDLVLKAYKRIERQETLYSSCKWMLSLSSVLVDEGVNGIKFEKPENVESKISLIKKDIGLDEIPQKLDLDSTDDYFCILFSTLEINFRETEIPTPKNFNSDKDLKDPNLLHLKALKVCCEKPLPLFLHLLTSLTSPNLENILNEVCESRPLHHAAKSGNSSAVAYLLECGASPLSKDRSGFLPIQYAAMFSHGETGDILISKLATDSEKNNQKKLQETYSQYYDKYLDSYGLSRGDTGNSRYVNVQTYEQLLTRCFDHIKKQLVEKGVENFATENLVSYTDGEAREIKDAVAQFLYLLKEQISLKNEMFEGDIGFVGSSEDNVRLYCPDEYDCNLLLKKISAYPDGEMKAEVIDLDEAKAIQYGHKKSLKVQPVREDLRSLMKGTCFLDSFYNIARESLTEMDLNGGKLKVIMPGIKRTQVGINLSFLWLGTEYPMLFIDIDFVPTVRAPWPEGLPKPNCSLDRRHLKEVYLNNVGEDEWRLSFGPTETKIMRGLSVNKRDVFLVCKMILAAFKTENWVPAEIKNQFMYWDSRMFSLHSKGGFALKNCFFQELESITNEEEWTKDKILKRVKSVFERMCLIEEQRSLVGGMEVDGQYPKPVKAYFGGDTEKASEYFIAPEIVRFLRGLNKN